MRAALVVLYLFAGGRAAAQPATEESSATETETETEAETEAEGNDDDERQRGTERIVAHDWPDAPLTFLVESRLAPLDGEVLAFSQSIIGGFRITDDVQLHLRLGLAYASDTGPTPGQSLRPGNVVLGVGHRTFGLVELALPVARDAPPMEPDVRPGAETLAYVYAREMTGGWNAWAFTPERIGIAYSSPRIRWVFRAGRFALEASPMGAVAFLFAVTENDRPLVVHVQIGGEVLARYGPVYIVFRPTVALESEGSRWAAFEPAIGAQHGWTRIEAGYLWLDSAVTRTARDEVSDGAFYVRLRATLGHH